MNERDILAGLEDVPWPDLECAGDPEETSALLRAVVSGSEEADEALVDLACSLFHQGSVYPASERAAPFLARIAAAGLHVQPVLEVLGSIAASNDERDLSAPGAARAAVAAQSGLLAPLLADPDPEVRAAAAWALTQAQAPALVLLLTERWSTETQPLVRATILKALSVLAPDLAARLSGEVLDVSADGGLLLIAAAASVAAGQPWTDRLHAAATAWMADGEVLPDFWDDDDPFEGLILALAARGEPAAAVRLVSAGLTYAGPAPVGSAAPADPAGSADPASAPARTPAFRADPGPGRVRQRSAWSAHELARAYRSPAPALMLPLAAAADDGDAGVDALSLLRELHAAGIPGVAEPAVADRVAAVADLRGQDRRADEALACLIDLGDPRAVPLLARDLRHRPFALDAAAEAAGGEFHSHPPRSPLAPAPVLLPCDPALLAAVREYLPVRDRRSKAPARLLALVSSWGPAAVAAIPEVLGLRPVYPLAVARVLAAVDPAHPELLPMVRPLAAAGPMGQRQNAASLLRDLTGADEPLLAVFEEGLREHGAELQWVAEAIARLGPAAASLAPAIAAALYPAASPRPKSGDSSWAQAHEDHARIQLALALAAVTGDAAPAIPVLAEILSPDPPDAGDTWVASAAADAAAVLGAPALSLVPALVPLLDDPACVPAAARALLRIDPGRLGGVPPARLADLLVTDVANTSSHNQQQAVDVLAGLGPARLPAGAVDRLRHLAERDQRLREAGFIDHIIRDDEKLRSGLRQLLSQLP